MAFQLTVKQDDKDHQIYFFFLQLTLQTSLIITLFFENILLGMLQRLVLIKRNGTLRTSHVFWLTKVIFSASQCTFQGSSLRKSRKKGKHLMHFVVHISSGLINNPAMFSSFSTVLCHAVLGFPLARFSYGCYLNAVLQSPFLLSVGYVLASV